MAYLLFPGRHIINTTFQENYLWDVLRLPLTKLDMLGSRSWKPDEKIDTVIFAITSANQDNSRYNPVSFHDRAISVDRFARPYREAISIKSIIIGIPNYDPTDRFADYLVREIADQTENMIVLTPENTIILSSTPSLIKLYVDLGFSVLPAEYDVQREKFLYNRPTEIVPKLMEAGNDWQKSPHVKEIAKSTISLWDDFPHVPKKIIRLWQDPLLNDQGSLTETRNYSTYAYGMGHGPLLEQKYKDIKDPIISGKIVDEGCADGALLVRLSKDFPDSDFIGIELTSEFLARCHERQRAGEFGGAYVHFHQRNLMDKIFEDNSIDTTICNSTTHEIWSYGNRKESLEDYLQKKFNQTRLGGRLVIRDVVGPESKNDNVHLWLNDADGSNDDPYKKIEDQTELAAYLSKLSTHARFLRFSKEYLSDMRTNGKRGSDTQITYEEETIGEKRFVMTTLKNAVEFMTKKDYTDNWQSELNEEFAFWSFSEWKSALEKVGFKVIENPNDPTTSRTYSNHWIVENRFKGKVELFRKKGKKMESVPYPITNMVLIGEKLK